MINTGEALELFARECGRTYGEDFKLETGDIFAVVLNNCVMFITVNNDKNIKVFTAPDVIKINESLDIYCDSNNGPEKE